MYILSHSLETDDVVGLAQIRLHIGQRAAEQLVYVVQNVIAYRYEA